MSVIVKDMEMPKDCYNCPLHDGENGRCNILGITVCDYIPKECPLVDEMSVVQSEQKKGKWIESARRIGTKFHPDCPDFYSVFVCSSCLKANDRMEKYCPNCGAKMGLEE